MRKDVITIAEADVVLFAQADWLSLSDAVKIASIGRASVYVQTKWSCADIDWEDDTTIFADVKEAIAYFAYADSKGVLYGNAGQLDSDILSSKSVKAASVTVTKVYATSRTLNTPSSSMRQLGYPTDLMSMYCTKAIYSQPVTRV